MNNASAAREIFFYEGGAPFIEKNKISFENTNLGYR